MNIFRRTLTCAAAALFGLGFRASAEDKLNIYLWPEYLPESVVKKFEKEVGCKVVVDTFQANEDMIAKVQAGGSGYDIVCPSDYAVTTMVRQGLLIELDHSKLPNLKNIAPRFANPGYDAELKHVVPYLAGTSGLGYNKKKVATPPKKWADLYDPAQLKTWKGKVSIIDDPKEGPASALLALGLDPNTTDEKDLQKALDLLKKQKPFLAGYDSENFEDTLLNGQTLITQGYSGDFLAAMQENANLGYFIPEEGCVVAVDNFGILKDAKHKELAMKFLDFICRPEVAAEIVNEIGYIPCNSKADSLIKDSVKNSPTFKLPAPDKSFTLKDLGQEGEDARGELWEALKGE